MRCVALGVRRESPLWIFFGSRAQCLDQSWQHRAWPGREAKKIPKRRFSPHSKFAASCPACHHARALPTMLSMQPFPTRPRATAFWRLLPAMLLLGVLGCSLGQYEKRIDEQSERMRVYDEENHFLSSDPIRAPGE